APSTASVFALLPHRRSGTGAQPNGLTRVTVTIRWMPAGDRCLWHAGGTAGKGGDGLPRSGSAGRFRWPRLYGVGSLLYVDGGRRVDEHEDSLTRARQAHAARDWRTAAACFAAVPTDRLTADDLGAPAGAAWGGGGTG